MKSLHFKGQPVSDEASKVCVLYDPKDGRVVHVHGVTTLPGGRQVTKAEIEERTSAHAKALGHSLQGLKHLHVPISAVRQGGPLKVDAKSGGLVAAGRPPARTRDLMADRRKAKAKR